MEDPAVIHLSHCPPPPPERPTEHLKRAFTSPILQKKLSDAGLQTTGTKSDLAIRLAHHESFVDISDVDRAFTAKELRSRLPGLAKSLSKRQLCEKYCEHLL